MLTLTLKILMRIVHRSDPISYTEGLYSPPFVTSAICVGTAGVLVARLRGDAAARPWPVAGSMYLLGDFDRVEESGTTSTGCIAVTDR